MKRIAVVTLALLASALSDHAYAAGRQKQVLALYANRRNAQIAVVGDREIPRVLAASLPDGVDYYSEFIDRARVPTPAYRSAFRDFLQLKYGAHAFDLIIAVGDIPLDFIRHAREVFGSVPIVFFAS